MRKSGWRASAVGVVAVLVLLGLLHNSSVPAATTQAFACDGIGGNVRAQGRTTLHIEDSKIVPNLVADQNATVSLKNSTVEDEVHEVGHATVHPIDTGVKGEVVSDPPAVVRRSAKAASVPPTRSFRMGLTPFPYDLTLEALAATKDFLHRNADVISIHLEGVPWLEAHTGEPFHPNLMGDWQRHKEAAPPQGKVYLSLSPLNNGRSGIAGYRAAEENLPLPAPFVGKALDAPIVTSAYLSYCRRAIRYFRPDFMTIGIEVNELFHNNRSQWQAYVTLHRRVYETLKRENPDLLICVTFTLHNMLNADWQDRGQMLAATKELMAYSDLVAASFYPFMAMLGGRMDESLLWLCEEFDGFEKPYIFSESGQPAEPVVLKSLGFTIPADPQRQRLVLDKLLSFADRRPVEFLIWYLPRDYDGLWDKIQATAPEFFGVWRDCGLLDGHGKQRPVYHLWRTHFQRPLRQE